MKLGTIFASPKQLDAMDAFCDAQAAARIDAARKELKDCRFVAVRCGRIGIEYRLYRDDGAYTLADSHKSKKRAWFIDKPDGTHFAKS